MSFTVPPRVRRTPRASSNGSSSHANWRSGEISWFHGVFGAGTSPVGSALTHVRASSAQLACLPSRRGRAQQARCVRERRGGRAGTVRQCVLEKPQRPRKRLRLPRHRWCRRALALRIDAVQDVHQGYGGDAVHHRVMQAHQEDRVAALMALDDRDSPERMISVKPLTEQLPDEGREHAIVAGRGHRDLFDMAIEVEVGVVLPRRIGEAQGRGYHALAIARQQMQPGSEQLDELIAREVPLVDHALADVHWLVAPLPVQEDRIVEAQASVRGVVGDGR